MFCTNCGKEAEEKNSFCGSCGTKMGAVPNDAPPKQPISLTTPINHTQTSASKGTGALIFGAILSIGGIIGLIYFVNVVSNPWFTFVFGGCRHWSCSECEVLSVVIVLSIIALIIGIISGVRGISKMKNNNQ